MTLTEEQIEDIWRMSNDDEHVAFARAAIAASQKLLLSELRNLAWREGATKTVHAIDAIIGTSPVTLVAPSKPPTLLGD